MGLAIMLNVAGRMCVIVGGGSVAARKITGLLEADARVTLISPEIVEPIKNLLEHIHWEQRPYAPGVLESYRPTLVYAATDDPDVNRQIAQEAETLGVLVNVADGTYESSFSNMTTIRRPPLTIALHTGGTSPALAKHLGAVLEAAVGDEYAILAQWLGDLRYPAREQLDNQAQRQQLYEAVLTSDILALLRQQQIEPARQQFESLVRTWGIDS
jgi:precorrin-2 dehydrogenase/sirohydrochlorin ferrochelatase